MSNSNDEVPDINTGKIKQWRSILTLVVFVIASKHHDSMALTCSLSSAIAFSNRDVDITVLFPSHIPIPVPLALYRAGVKGFVGLRVIPARGQYDRRRSHLPDSGGEDSRDSSPVKPYVWFRFPINFVTGPLIADLFLLAIGAIGGDEVSGGIVGSDHIVPYDILIFFFSLAYIAISIDASGLIRYLAFKVLQLGGKVGHRLFFFLYAFFFGLGSFIGNDPIILSGTAFLAYMTRVSSNIVHPRAWIHTQFSIANIASAILVSSNPTNLVLAGAFKIKFIDYTRDMVVPVVITAIVLFPFLLYFVFADESLIPSSIKMHELDEEARRRKPVNPNIPYGRGTAGEDEKKSANNEETQLLSLEEIMNPFLDKVGAAFGGFVMAATLIIILVLNEYQSSKNKETPVFYVTLPAAVVMLAFDLAWGWIHRKETRKIAHDGRQQVAEAAERKRRQLAAEAGVLNQTSDSSIPLITVPGVQGPNHGTSYDERDEQPNSSNEYVGDSRGVGVDTSPLPITSQNRAANDSSRLGNDNELDEQTSYEQSLTDTPTPLRGIENDHREFETPSSQKRADTQSTDGIEEEEKAAEQKPITEKRVSTTPTSEAPRTLVSISADTYEWLQDTFPTVVAVLSHLPFALLPFSFEMFILVQGLVTKGWVAVFAYGWTHWVAKTGTIGAIGGMGFLAVILCNVSQIILLSKLKRIN
jgi:Na+/H+ antiporter NhaD/arsenite permease-like protein